MPMDLATDYLGLRLRNPLVASASPLSQTVEGIRRLADAGIGAVVLYSQFEEQLGDERIPGRHQSTGEVPNKPQRAEQLSPSGYLGLLEQARSAVDVPVIGSLNGATARGWVSYARAMQDAGASAVELNVYWIPGPGVSASEVESRHVEVLSAVKAAVSVPVAVKLSPFFIASGEVALRLDAAGADGLVLFNRFLQPDIDPDTLKLVPTLELSSPAEARLARTWISLLRQRVRGSLAATTGVEDAADVARYLLAGADVVMTASALLRHGVGHVGTLLAGLHEWMTWKGFDSVDSARGLLSVPADTDPAAYTRAGYLSVLEVAKFSHSRW
jgi:dihydroorotate dehydrogenase (fumarate)